MKCLVCSEDYPFIYYFATETVCRKCHENPPESAPPTQPESKKKTTKEDRNSFGVHRGLLLIVLTVFGCQKVDFAGSEQGTAYKKFRNPMRVCIQGYDGDAMEPFISRDGQWLFFNNSNSPTVDTNLYYAERIDSLTFRYKGELGRVNTSALEGVPTMDLDGTFYFVSPRTYDETFSTIYRGHFTSGRIDDIELVPGISREESGIVNFDVEVSSHGRTLYFVDSRFGQDGNPRSADIVIGVRRGSGFDRLSSSSELLKHINTKSLEYAVSISSSELEMFFTRWDRRGEPTIYRAARNSPTDAFGIPQRVTAITGYVEAPALSSDESMLYYHKKEGNQFVIYRVER